MGSGTPGHDAQRVQPVISRRWLSFGVVSLLALTAFCAKLESQGAPSPGAVMLKRIAEAVDGNRSGGLVYVVASYAPTNPVLGVFGNPKDAEDAARRAGSAAAVFGPYQTDLETGGRNVAICVHDGYLSRMDPTRCPRPQSALLPEDIAGLTLLISRTNGSRDTIALPAGSDAIFLGMPAIDKFVLPYYLRTLGLSTVTEMRRDFQQAFTSGTDAKR